MALSIASFLVYSPALGADDFPCLVKNVLSKTGEMRPASPKEASRKAAEIWKSVREDTLPLEKNWVFKFQSCLKASGLPFEMVIYDPLEFQQRLYKDIEKHAKNLRGKMENLDNFARIEAFEKKLAMASELFPETENKLSEFKFSGKEREELFRRQVEALRTQRAACSPKDFSSRFGMVRNQTDKGWCYAFAAAEIMSFKIGADSPNFSRRVSAVDLALMYNLETINWLKIWEDWGADIAEKEGGWTGKALESALENGGFCLESDSPSEEFSFGYLEETIAGLRALKEKSLRNQISDTELCYGFERVKEVFANVQLQDFADILQEYGDSNWDYFVKLNKKNCEGKRHPHGLTKKNIHELYGKEEMLKEMNAQLDKNNVSAVGFNADMILTKAHWGSGGHAVTLVGRKFDESTGQCKYLIRNSWGYRCPTEVRAELCAKDKPGHQWVDHELLSEHIIDVTYID